MVNVNDCGCPCEDNGKKKQIEERALSSINKIYTTEGATYYPDGTGMVTLPLPTAEQIQQIGENSERLTIDEETLRQLKISDAENVEAIAQAQRDISAHAEEIGDIKATDAQQDTKIKTAEGEIDALKTLTDSITKSLIADVEVRDGAGSGTFLVELTEEDGTKRTSDTYQYGQVGSFELIQGTEAGYVRGRLTLTNGVVKESNDYQILQLVESDVYVTAITLTPDYTAGKLGGEIGYSNGNKAQIDPVLVPTAPGVTSNIDALLKRMTSAETVDKEQTAKIANLETRVKAIEDTPGVGQFAAGKLGTIKGGTTDGSVQAQEDGTGTVVGWSGKADTADVAKKADKTALDATDAKVTQIQTAVGDCFNAAEITSDGKLQLTAVDGQVNELTLPSGGEFIEISKLSDIDIGAIKIGSTLICKEAVSSGATISNVQVIFIGYYPGTSNRLEYTISGVTTKQFDSKAYAPIFNKFEALTNITSNKLTNIWFSFTQSDGSLGGSSISETSTLTKAYISY